MLEHHGASDKFAPPMDTGLNTSAPLAKLDNPPLIGGSGLGNLNNNREPRCTAVEVLERQSPFVSSTLAQHTLAPLRGVLKSLENSSF
jgi:hypothetical protein